MAEPSRNAPCPCGSGRRYKQCCGGARGRPPDDPDRAERQRTLQRFLDFAFGEGYTRDMEVGLALFGAGDPAPDAPERPSDMAAFALWATVDMDLDEGRTVLDEYLSAPRPLSEIGRRYLERLRGTAVRLYEVTAVRAGDGLDVRDLWSDEKFTVRERLGSGQLSRWDVLGARLIAAERGPWQFEAVPYVFPPDMADDLLRELRRIHRSFRGGSAAGDDTAFFKRVGPALHRLWLERVTQPPMPTVRTVEGDTLATVRMVFTLRDPAGAAARLDGDPDLESDGANAWVWLEPGPEESRRRILGSLRLAGDRLTLETWSEERAARGRERLTKLLGTMARHRSTVVEDPLAAIADRDVANEPEVAPASPEEEAMLREFFERHYREWLDQPVPGLGDRTPRHAARLKTVRPKLVGLLKAIENHAERDRRLGRPSYDVSWMWKELGLE